MRTKQQIKEYQKKWRQNNSEKTKFYSKQWRELNYEKNLKYQRQYQRAWREKNRDKVKESVKKSYYKHHIKRLTDRRAYYEANKKEENKYRVKLIMKKYHEDPITWLIMNCRSRLNKALKRGVKTFRKNSATIDLLGADIGTIRKYIEAQFQEGMTWSNRGKWHIDHIKPISSFDLADEREQKMAFNYKNLQPLWAKDNLKKGKFYVIR